MEHVADRVVHDIRMGSEMRPRRWYSDEIAPQRRRNVKLNAHYWRYRSFIRRKREDAAPAIGAASSFVQANVVFRNPSALAADLFSFWAYT
jgi:hypothetical protein